VADRWAAEAARAKGLAPFDPAVAEEVLSGPYITLRHLRLQRRSLLDIARWGVPRIPGPVTTLPDGRAAARVVPADIFDRLLFPGVSAEVWMQPGIGVADLRATQALAYQHPDAGGVCLVLGGGNVTSIAPLDAIYKLFVANRVVILKMHPAIAYMGPILEQGLWPLIREGFLRIVHGGATEGAYLVNHPGIDELHITGSYRTYEAIVFGAGSEGDERRRRDEPILRKPFTAELGNLTPVTVAPGRWSDSDIAYHADNIATMLTNNAGFNCTTARLLITQAGWRLRHRLLEAIRARLGAIHSRAAYYPGAADRFDRFVAAHPRAEVYGERAGDRLPWGLIADLDPGQADELCFTTEAFCGIFGELPLPSGSTADFLDRAVAFANDSVWGSLNATLIVQPASLRDPATTAALERAIADLRYGTVSINHWSTVGYALGTTPWGAFPGHARNDIGSGTDVVHNTLMFSRSEKTVIPAPFRAWPKPIWFGTHATARRLAPKLVRFEAHPSLPRVAGMLPLAVRG
jgi:acyl-CoA reductase-like NAD-dependent aldehyde dehydrogenase